MEKENWKDSLRACFENIEVLERCKRETAENFKQFCEFIAEPAFEALAEELREYGIKAKFWTLKGKSISLQLSFPHSKVDNFYYIISLPKNSIQLKLRLQIRGRRTERSSLKEIEADFSEKFAPAKVMKIAKEELIESVIEFYKNFTYEAQTTPE